GRCRRDRLRLATLLLGACLALATLAFGAGLLLLAAFLLAAVAALAATGVVAGAPILAACVLAAGFLPPPLVALTALALAALLPILVARTAGVLVLAAIASIAPRRRRSDGRCSHRRWRSAAEEGGDPRQQAGLSRRNGGRGRRRFLGLFAQRCRSGRADVGDRGQVGDVEVGARQGMGFQLARRGAVVAGARGFLAQLVLADAGDLEVRGFQLVVRHDHDRRVVAGLDLADRAALLVEQGVGDLRRRLHQHLAGVLLHGVLFGQPQDGQRQRLDAADAAVAAAARADLLARLAERGAQPLARHFQQAEAGDAAQLHPGAVHLQR